jgi:peptidoglycan/LPS O-acetylase OafA/YrhL
MTMQKIPPNTSIWLNVMRALAAQAVVIGHANYLFFSYDNASGNKLAWLMSFFGSGAHKAVVMFFVMSGFLIGGPVILAWRSNTFDATKYFVGRLTRLWIVILPALLLTALLDGVAFQYGNGAHLLSSRVPFFPEWWASIEPNSLRTFLFNVFFLQMIIGFQYGTNLSLWSISNEFWYYILLPAALGIYSIERRTRLVFFAVTVGVILLFMSSAKPNDLGRPAAYFFMFILWIMGAILYVYYESKARRMISLTLFLLGLAAFVLFKIIYPDAFGYDLAMAFFALSLIAIAKDVPAARLKKFADFFSSYSFSLYALHLPLTFFLLSFDPELSEMQALRGDTLLRFFAYLLVINIAAIAMWALTERHTDKLRRFTLIRLAAFRPAR